MAFNSYTALKASIASFLARDDLTAQIPDFISLAEARMSRELKTRTQVKRATAATIANTEFIILPTDMRQVKNVKLNSSPNKQLNYVTPAVYYERYPGTGGGTPSVYTVIGAEIGFRPIPDSVQTVEIIYTDEITPLSDTVATNRVLQQHPDIYLYGSLAQAHAFLMDDARATQYDGLFSRIIEEIKNQTDAERFSGSLSISTSYSGA